MNAQPLSRPPFTPASLTPIPFVFSAHSFYNLDNLMELI